MMLAPHFLRSTLVRAMAQRKPLLPTARKLNTCIFKLDRIGDFVLALSAIRRLTEFYGEEECALVVHQMVEQLARREFPKAEIIALPYCDGGIRSALILFRKEARIFQNYSFQNLICLRYSRTLIHNLVINWIHAENSLGFENSSFGIFAPDEKILQYRFTKTLTEISALSPETALELIRHQKLCSEVYQSEVAREDILPKFRSLEAKDGTYLLVSPFGSKGIRSYPEQKLITACSQISSKLPIVLYGTPADQPQLHGIMESARRTGLTNIRVAAPGTILDFCASVASARAVLTMETSTAHIATALDKPTVTILGGGHHGIFGPWRRSTKQVWVSNRVPCFGCDWRCIHQKPVCITEISPNVVADAVLRIAGD